MSVSARLSAIDRVQRTTGFKIAASVVIAIAMLTYAGFSVVGATLPGVERLEAPAQQPEATDADADAGGAEARVDNVLERRRAQIRGIIEVSRSPLAGILGALALSGIALLVVWLGLGLTYIAALLLGLAIGLPMYLLGGETVRTLGFLIMGVTGLLLSFSVLIRGLSMALSTPHPVTTIARNVLAEAVRMKVSLVLILALAFMLAAMPMILDAEQPLRYRVQAFLQWSTGLSFWLIALLVVFFSVATVSYEQREKVIWQTMTKPVTAWQYILGKWLGVVLLGGALLSVTGVGVYQFTEYLRSQPAIGESAPYVPQDDSQLITEDRLILETQVLSARRTVYPTLPFVPGDERFDEGVRERIERERRLQTNFNPTPAQIEAIRAQLVEEAVAEFRSIEPRAEGYETFTFRGLGEARNDEHPLTLRYKINAGGNPPDEFYSLTFVFEDGTVFPPRTTGLGFSHTMTIDPDLINDDGVLRVQLYNGAFRIGPSGGAMFRPNPSTASVPPDGMEISHPVGTYTGNFARIVGVLWVKLALLSIVAVFASSFASFPVASLISVSVFLMAEGARFVQDALVSWDRTSDNAGLEITRNAVYHFADAISGLLSAYADLRPTQRLADGIALRWGEVSSGVAILGIACAVFYILGVLVFKRRELAIYSGH